MPVPLSEDDLLDMRADNLSGAVRSLFLAHLRNAPPVRDLFFRDSTRPSPLPATGVAVDLGWVERVSIALVCAAIGRSGVRDFHQLINRSNVQAFLAAELTATSPTVVTLSRALCNVVFAERASSRTAERDGNLFSAYLNDQPEQWGERLFAAVTAQPFRTMMETMVTLTPDKARDKVTRTLMIVGRLAPSKYEALRSCFTDWFGAAMVGQENQINPSDYDEALFLNEVTAQESREESVSNPSHGFGMHQSLPSWTVYYGPGVKNFVQGPGRQFWSGSNVSDSTIKTALSCFAAGTTLHLADGKTIPIETVAVGQRVLAEDGAVGVVASDDPRRTVESGGLVHGLNDMPPFFTAAHLIMTMDGPKAIDPSLPRRINPALEVGTLAVGDRVIRLVSVEPFRTETVTIDRLTAEPLPVGGSVYSLALDGPQTYFAGGILVSANHPDLTEARMADALASLSAREREHLGVILTPVLPLLWEVLRGFAGSRLRELLEPSRQEEEPAP